MICCAKAALSVFIALSPAPDALWVRVPRCGKKWNRSCIFTERTLGTCVAFKDNGLTYYWKTKGESHFVSCW